MVIMGLKRTLTKFAIAGLFLSSCANPVKSTTIPQSVPIVELTSVPIVQPTDQKTPTPSIIQCPPCVPRYYIIQVCPTEPITPTPIPSQFCPPDVSSPELLFYAQGIVSRGSKKKLSGGNYTFGDGREITYDKAGIYTISATDSQGGEVLGTVLDLCDDDIPDSMTVVRKDKNSGEVLRIVDDGINASMLYVTKDGVQVQVSQLQMESIIHQLYLFYLGAFK